MTNAALVPVSTDAVIINLDRARLALREAKTIQDTKKILDVSAAAEIYARRQKLGEEAIGYAHEIKIEALRLLGEMLKETPRNEGQIRRGTQQEPRENIPTLAEMGVDKKTSSIAQKLADLPEKEFADVKAGHVAVGKAIATVDAKAKPSADVPRAKYDALHEKYNELQENCEDLAGELKNCEAIRNGDQAQEMKVLRESLKQANRSRDDAMRTVTELRKQCEYFQRELKKLGWKPKK